MRNIERLYTEYWFAAFFFLLSFAAVEVVAQENPEVKIKLLEIRLTVVDEEGNAIPEASVVVGEGYIHAHTDSNGAFTCKAAPDDFFTISANGYEKSVQVASDIIA